jgi:4-amino-4-deoxychorismate synthase (2-amino-4-deoxychorismate-forming) component II
VSAKETAAAGARVFLVDNYDSFVYNLYRYVRELGADCVVRRNNVALDEIRDYAPTHIVISPGPCTPREAGVSNAVIEEFSTTVPILGVCLGHQCVGQVFGGTIARADRPVHGKTSKILHTGSALFAGIDNPFEATRYHSLVVSDEAVPECLEVTATTEAGEIMALEHKDRPCYGVQFHPESFLTKPGHRLLENFLKTHGAAA